VSGAAGSARFITAAMKAAVGRELDRLVSFPIAASDIRKWAVAVYHPHDPPPLFWDASVASASAHRGIVAPEEFNPFAWMVATPHGRKPGYVPGGPSVEARLGLPEVDTDYMLNGGTDITYGVRMRPGDVITSVTSLSDYSEREGRLGLMLFTKTTARWVNQDDELVKSVTNAVIRY
jgi:hypothetical protein